MAAFLARKSTLKNHPVLAYPRFGEPFKLYTDASATHIGAVLSQKGKDGVKRAVAYWSKVLNIHQKNYAVSEQECLALVAAVGQFRVYLIGNKCTVHTNQSQSSAVHFGNVKPRQPLLSRLRQWTVALQEYNPEIKYRPGTQMALADAMSRPPTEFKSLKEEEEIFSYVQTITDGGALLVKKRKETEEVEENGLTFSSDEILVLQELRQKQEKDGELKLAIEYLESGGLAVVDKDQKIILVKSMLYGALERGGTLIRYEGKQGNLEKKKGTNAEIYPNW